MGSYIIRRLGLIIPTLLIVTMIVFLSLRFIPGNIVEVIASQLPTEGDVSFEDLKIQIEKELGLDKPIYTQYGIWLGRVVRGDLGESLWSNTPVIDDIKHAVPISAELGIIAILVGLVTAVPIGIYSALRQDTVGDYIARTVAITFIALPSFWIGTIVIVYPSIWWNWMPALEYIPITKDFAGNIVQFIIPGAILGLVLSGTTMRMTRTMMLEVLRQDYIRTAWSKGLRERTVVIRHAVKNALIPVVTTIGLMIPVLVGGTVVLEQIFSLPGLGRLLIESLQKRDYPIVSGINIALAAFILVINLLVDMTYSYLDPRIRYK
jgi:peptide/nickel transport system permease protein